MSEAFPRIYGRNMAEIRCDLVFKAWEGRGGVQYHKTFDWFAIDLLMRSDWERRRLDFVAETRTTR